MACQLSILPFDYYPCDNDGGFQDNIDDITSLQFKDIGVKCNCTGKVYYNKYSFKTQHMKSQKHQDYLKELVNDKPNLIKTMKENQKTLKTLKIQLGASEQKLSQALHTQKQTSEKIEKMMGELLELQAQLTDLDDYIKDMELNHKRESQLLNEEIAHHKQGYDLLKEKTESILKQFMSLYEYEVD